MSHRRVALFCCLVVGVVTVHSARPADWPYYQHDPEHTGRSTAFVDALQLTLSWEAPDGYATPQIVGDTVYSTKWQGGFSGSQGGGNTWATYITAFNLATGAVKWSHSGNYVFASQAAVGGGLVVFHGGVTSSPIAPPTPAAGQLVVLDAATGALLYTVPEIVSPSTGVGGLGQMPLLIPNPADGTVMAYYLYSDTIWGVRLGRTSGSIVWRGNARGGGIPTLVGDSVVVAGAGHFYAFHRLTGARHDFYPSGGSGGGSTVAYDAERQHIYVLESTTVRGTLRWEHVLTAFKYRSHNEIDFLWQRIDPPLSRGSVALGPSGNVYVTGYVSGSGGVLLELNPQTGATIRSVPGTFQTSLTPAVTAGLLWVNTQSSGSVTMPPSLTTTAYDLETMRPLRTLPGGNSQANNYSSPGAFADGYFVMARGDIVGSKGFAVWRSDARGDFNRDTHTDLIWQNNSTGQRGIWLMNSVSSVGERFLPTIPLEWQIAGTGDFNRDGQTDIVWQNTANGQRGIWFMNGTSWIGERFLPTIPTEWEIAGTGDFNRDTHVDLIWQNRVTGQRGFWLMNGTNWAAERFLPTIPLEWQIVATGDFNTDQQTDIVWENTVTGERGIWLMNGTAWAGERFLPTIPLEWSIAGAADFNSDGQTDIIWQNTTTGQRGFWLMNGTTWIGERFLPTIPTEWEIRNR